MSKIVVKPNKLQDISMLLNQNIDGIIFPIENLSVESSFFIDIDEVINLCKMDHIKGLSILGGEPWHPNNIEGTTKLVKKFKKELPNKTIWSWSGYNFEDYLSKQEGIKYVDVIVDGRFVEELKDPRLKYMGSSNQRAIDVTKSLKSGKVVLYEEE